MAWTAPRTWVVGEVLTAALLNTHLRDNMLETAPAKAATAGDVFYADDANSLAVLAGSGNGGKVVKWNAGGTALVAGSGGVIAADAYEWNSKLAQVYTLLVGGGALAVQAVYGDLIDQDWAANSVQNGTSSWANDFNDQADALAGPYLEAPLDSPPIIGGWNRIDAISELIDSAVATITISMWCRRTATTQGTANYMGFGNHTGVTGSVGIINGATNFELELLDGTGVDTGFAKVSTPIKLQYVIDVVAETLAVNINSSATSITAADISGVTDKWPMGLELNAQGALFAAIVKYE